VSAEKKERRKKREIRKKELKKSKKKEVERGYIVDCVAASSNFRI